MSLGALLVASVLSVLVVVIAVYYFGKSDPSQEYDTGDMILEFARAFPDEAVRSVATTVTGDAGFLRLASGKSGFLKAMGKHYVVRLLDPGAVSVEALENNPGLRIEFRDSSLPVADYIFKSTEEAAEVSLWLCGSFTLANTHRRKTEIHLMGDGDKA